MKSFQIYNSVSKHHFSSPHHHQPPSILSSLSTIFNNWKQLCPSYQNKVHIVLQTITTTHTQFYPKFLLHTQSYLWPYFYRQQRNPKRLIGRKNRQTNTFFKLTLNKTPNTKLNFSFYLLQFKFIQKNQLIFWQIWMKIIKSKCPKFLFNHKNRFLELNLYVHKTFSIRDL